MGIGRNVWRLSGYLFIFLLFTTLSVSAIECNSTPTEECTISDSITFDEGLYNQDYGFKINSSNITIDCNGATFNNTDPDGARTLFDGEENIGDYWSNYTNITIKNCNIHNFEEGVWLLGSNFTLKNNNFVGHDAADDWAAKLYGPGHSIINNTLENMYFGFRLGYSYQTEFHNNSFIDMDEEHYLKQYYIELNSHNSSNVSNLNFTGNYFDNHDSCDIIDKKIKDDDEDSNLPEVIFSPLSNEEGNEMECKSCVTPSGDSYSVTENTYICPGTYDLDYGFDIEADNVTLDCLGSSFHSDFSDPSRVGISSSKDQLSSTTIKNCNFEDYIHAIDFGDTNITSSELSNIKIKNTNHEGMDFQKITDSLIQDIDINFSSLGSSSLGGLMIETIEDSVIENSQFISNQLYGLRMLNSNDNLIESNFFKNSTRGIHHQYDGKNISILDNRFESSFSTGSHDEENAIILNADNSFVKDNEFVNGFPLAVEMDGNNNIFENNRFYVDYSSAGANENSLKLKGSENIVRNNQFEDASDIHIYLVGSDYNLITGNTFNSNYYDGFYYQNHKNPIVIRTTTSYENIAANNTMNGSHDGHGTRPAIDYSYCPSSNCLDLENNNFFDYENYILLNNQSLNPKNISNNIRQNYWGPNHTDANLTCEYIDDKFYDDEEMQNESFAIDLSHGILDAPYPDGNTVDCTYNCYGRDSNEPDVCSGNGVCVDKDTCECNGDWSGSQCQDFSPSWNLTFDAGWNLASLPMAPETKNCSLLDHQMDYELIYQTNTSTEKWDMCLANNSKFSNLEFDTSRPFWINVTEPLNETQDYPINTYTEENLSEGWNLIPYPWHKRENISVVFDDLDEITHVYEYDEGIWKLWMRDVPVNPLTEMKPGKAYWISSTANITMKLENGTATER